MRPRRTADNTFEQKIKGSSADRNMEKQERRSLSASKTDYKDFEEMTRTITELMSELTPIDGHRYSSGGFQLKPSQKALLTVCATLMRELDDTFQFEDLDLEFLPEMFKTIGYFSPINKNIFMPVGAPHTWPSCITLMHWLAQLAKYRRSEVVAGEKRKDFYEEASLVQELIVTSFNDNPDEEWLDDGNFDSLLETEINKEKQEVTQLENEKILINQQLKELNANYPDLAQLKQSSEALDKLGQQEKLELRSSEKENGESEADIERMLQEDADAQEELRRAEQDILEMEQKIEATGTNSQKVEAAQAEITRSLARMKKRKEELADFNRAHEGRIRELMNAGQMLQEEIESIKAKYIQEANHLKQRGFIFNFRDIPLAHMEELLREANIVNFAEIQEFYNDELEELKSLTSRRIQQSQAQRQTIGKDVEKVEQTEAEVQTQVEEQLEIKNRLIVEVEQLKASLNSATDRHNKALENLKQATKAKEEAEVKLVKVQRQRLTDQQDVDRRAIMLEASAGKVQLYAKRCEGILTIMTTKAQAYDEETKLLMRKQASSFAQLHNQMEKEYGDELTRRR